MLSGSCQRLSFVSKFCQVGFNFFLRQSCLQVQPHLTKRAPDAGDSGENLRHFSRLIIFLVGRLRRPRPSAGNANRWVAPCITWALLNCHYRTSYHYLIYNV